MADLGVSTQYRITLSPQEFRLIMKALRVAGGLSDAALVDVSSKPTATMQGEMLALQDTLFRSQQNQLKGFAAHAEKIAKEES